MLHEILVKIIIHCETVTKTKGIFLFFSGTPCIAVIKARIKFSGSWEPASAIPHVLLQIQQASFHTFSYSFFMALRPCPDHDSYNTVVEMFDC